MSGPTKLYQRAGSPLIHGRSRYERAFVRDWFLSGIAALVALYAIYGTATLFQPEGVRVDSLEAMLGWVSPMLPGLVGLVPGSALGAWVARVFGWRHAWIAGGIVGTAAGIAAIILWGSIG